MAMDLRHVMAAFLTLAMFVMLGNMIKRDHFESVVVKLPASSSTVQYDVIKISKQSIVKLSGVGKEAWKGHGEALKPCWNKHTLKGREQSKGFIIFSLTDGPEYHVSQIANAVVVARYLGATLVLPDIRGSRRGDKRSFGEIYDVKKFINSLDGLVRVAMHQPAEISSGNLAVVRVPNRVSEDYIVANIKPLLRRKGNLRLLTYFPSSDMTKVEETGYLDSYSCLAMFESLQLQPRFQELVDSVVGRLRSLSQKPNGQFIAVDLRGEMLEKDKCQETEATIRKSCYNAQEISEFLKKIGFNRDTTIYLTESGWHSSLDALREIYPKTFTKEGLMPTGKMSKFLHSESSEFEKVLDFHVCSQSDFFVPALPGLFHANVAGKRIAAGKTQILIPAQITSASASDYISPYIYKKSHFAYSCLC